MFNNAARNYGKAMHVALAGLAMSCGSEYTKADVPKLNAMLATHFERYPQPPDDHRQLGLAQETLAKYIQLYEVEPWTILSSNGFPLIERLLHCPISSYNGIPINFFGILDIGVQKSDGDWVVDRKTTYQLGKNFAFEMAMTGQMRGYCWMYQKCFGKLPMGYIVDAIRTSQPTEKCQADKALLKKFWTEQFARLPFYIDQERLDEWEGNTVATLRRIAGDWEKSQWPMNDKSCVSKYGCCQFYDICSLPFAQRKVALQSNNFSENDWLARNLEGKI